MLHNPYLKALGITQWVEREWIEERPSEEPSSTVIEKKIPQPSNEVLPKTPLTSSKQDLNKTLEILNQNNQSRFQKWTSLKMMSYQCVSCQLSRTRIHNIFCHNPPDQIVEEVPVMIVFQSPSVHEDLQGDFILANEDQALLKNILNAMALTLDDVLMTYLVKCKENPSITDNAFEICKTYLLHQIHLLSPKLILFMGIKGYSISQLQADLNQLFPEKTNLPHVVNTTSLNQLRTQPDLKRKLWNDLKNIL